MALVLQLAASLTGAVALRSSPVASVPPPAPAPRIAPTPEVLAAPAPDPERERERAVRRLLDSRAAAVLARDREAFLATVSAGEPEFLERQGELFDALAEVPLASWGYELDPFRQRGPNPELDQRHGQDAWWAPDVQLRYAIDDFDPEATYAPQRLTFARVGQDWLLAADDDFASIGEASTRGLWDFGPVVAHRSQHALVLGHPGSRSLLPPAR